MKRIDMTPGATATHWSAGYVGRPWLPTFTCWDLAREVQAAVFGRATPAFDPAAEGARAALRAVVEQMANDCGWHRSDDAPADGDLLLMRGPDGLHIGVVVAGKALLHNLGGLVDGRAHGSGRIAAIDRLGQLCYGRFELWRAGQ